MVRERGSGVYSVATPASPQSSPAKWDSGFLSVAPPDGIGDAPELASLEEAEWGGRAGEMFALEVGDSPLVQSRQRRMSVSCPSSPVLPRQEAPAIPEGAGPERPHKENALSIPLVGFVAGSALDRFSSQDGPMVSLLVDSRNPSRRVSWNSEVVGPLSPNSRDAEDTNWSIRDFRPLWGTGDTDSMEGMGRTHSLEVTHIASSVPPFPILQNLTRTRFP